MRSAILSLLLVAGALGAAPGDSPFPMPPVAPQPMPAPPPQPVGGVLNLTAGKVYVINSKVDGVLLVHPEDLVTIVKKVGPLSIDAVFVDGTGGSETRDYAGPCVYLVKPVEGKSGRARVVFIPFGLKDAKEILRDTVDVNGGSAPTPPPKPVDPPKPDPTPVPAAVGAWVVVVQDESVAAPASLTGPSLAKLIADGRGHVYGTAKDAAKISAKRYDALLKDAGVTGSGLIVLDKAGGKVLVAALPATDAEVAAKLKGIVAGF